MAVGMSFAYVSSLSCLMVACLSWQSHLHQMQQCVHLANNKWIAVGSVFLAATAPSIHKIAESMLLYLVQEEVFLNGTIVLPHKEIKDSILDPGTIIM